MCIFCRDQDRLAGATARQDTAAVGTFAATGILPSFTLDQQARYLTDGYWQDQNWGRHRFDVEAGGKLSVNLTGLGDFARQTAIDALATWTAVTGITFAQTSERAQIGFSENQAGAWANSTVQGQTIVGSVVNVASSWTQYGTYYLQAFIHEIGHALGLGHAGNYNGSANFETDARYQQDSWQYSIMSYFAQDRNPYSSASYAYVVTPMPADIVAIQSLYGVPGDQRTGDDTYGDHRTIAGSGTDIAGGLAQTLFDGGGVDTIDLGSRNANQRLDLRAESFSDIDGRAGNLAIARGTTIENAVLGSGDDIVTGNEAANRISGGGGGDRIDGAGGHDVLIGGDGDDLLVGGLGADKLHGGAGNDTFHVDDARDVVVEHARQGTDLVRASVGYELGDDVENLVLTGDGDIGGRGNGLNNSIAGNEGNNALSGGLGDDTLRGGGGNDRLDGGGGFDRMHGGKGNDVFIVDHLSERPAEALREGTDRVESSVDFKLSANLENLTLTGQTAVRGMGNYLDNTIVGNDAANILGGSLGNDRLTGGAGNDRFVFDFAPNARNNVDTITDFKSGEDTIWLDDRVFSALVPGGLSAAAFAIGSAAGTAMQRIVYDDRTGSLVYDANGSEAGGATVFVTLAAGLSLGAGDFLVG